MKTYIFGILTLILIGCNLPYAQDWFLDSPSAVEPVEQATPTNSPAEVGRQYINAAFTMDFEAARNLTCAARRGEITDPTDEQRATVEAMNLDLSGLEFTVSDQTNESATVTVSGIIKVEAEGQEMELPIEQMIGSDTSVPVIKEDGQWLVCPNG